MGNLKITWAIKEQKLIFLLYAFFVACIFLLTHGYQFNNSDQAEHLPQVYKLIDPALYKGDYFMEPNAHTFTVRFFYVYLVYGLSFFLPISTICFILCVLCIALSVYSFMRLTEFFSTSTIAPYLSPLFIFLLFYNFTLGGVNLQSSSFICSSIGSSMAAYGILCFFRGNFYKMAIVLGIASLFQLMDAAQVFVLMFLLCVLENGKNSMREVFKVAFLYGLCAAPMFIPMFYKQFLHPSMNNSPFYYHILYHFRNPHHFLPSHFPLKDYLKTALLLAAGLWASLYLKRVQKASVYRLFFIIILGMMAYYMVMEQMGAYGIGKLQWFKTSMWMGAFNSILLASFLSDWVEQKWHFRLSLPKVKWISLGGIVLMMVLMLNSKYIPMVQLQSRYQVGNYRKTDLTLLHEWIQKHIPKESLILSPPWDDSFACEALRPSPIGYKAVIHEPFFMIPWYQKFYKIYGVNLADAEKGDVIALATQYYNTTFDKRESNIRYRIDDLKSCAFKKNLDSIICQKGDFVLTAYAYSAK